MMYPTHKQSGFTLLELLLVIFLLGVMAMTTFAVVQDDDDQQRFEATKTYYQLIKKAIVGDPTLTINGETDVSGFVADMGRLPNCLRELLDVNGCDGVANSADDLPAWTQDADNQVWAGWRGPYLQGIPESGGLTFRDGWKNQGGTTNLDVSNYGWLFGVGATSGTACGAANVAQTAATSLYVQSCGSDTAVGGSDYGQDYPFLSATSYLPLVVEADHQVVLGSEWETVLVEVVNDAGVAMDITKETLRLSVNYPINGALPTCAASGTYVCDPSEDYAPFISDTFPAFGWKTSTKVLTLAKDAYLTLPTSTTPVGSATSTTPVDTETTYFRITEDSVLSTDDGSQITLTGCTSASACTLTTSSAVTLSSTDYKVTAPADGFTVTMPTSKGVAVQFAVTGLLKPYIDVPVGSTANTNTQVTTPNGTTLTFNTTVKLMQDTSSRVMVNPIDNPTVTFSSAVTQLGNKISVTGSNDVFYVPPDSTLSGTTLTLGTGLALPAGQRSITVVCESVNNSDATNRRLFDGKCDTTDDAVPVPILFKAKPRATILPPSPLRWQLR